MKRRTKGKKGLTNAPERWILTLGGVMLKVKLPNGIEIECDTAEEAKDVIDHYEQEREEADDFVRRSAELPDGTKQAHLWKVGTFQKFIDALGVPQLLIMKSLTQQTRIADDELRKLVDVKSNQQLAGILSGISKQASALGIPARSVFTIEDERKGGDLQKTYVIADDFWRIANQMNWPIE